MDYSFTDEQSEFRAGLRTWLRQNLPDGWEGGRRIPVAGEEDEGLRREWERSVYDAGYAAVHWPVEHGGRGLSLVHQLIVSEELGRVAAPEPISTAGMENAGPLLMAAGTEAQKARFLRRIAAVEEIWCQGFTEPDAGSDLSALRTTARRDGQSWVISGRKIWTSHAHLADWCCLLARSDPDAPTRRAMTVFAVPMATPGITVRPLEQLTRRSDFNEISFEDARIPVDSNIGPVHDGWRVATEAVARERALIRLSRQARFENEFEHLVRIATGKQHGRGSTADDAHFRQRAAEIYGLLRIFRMYNLRLVSRVESSEPIGADASFVRLLWTEMHQQIGRLGLDVLDAETMFDDGEVSGGGRLHDVYLTSRADTIVAGTAQIHRNLIAERVLGMPR